MWANKVFYFLLTLFILSPHISAFLVTNSYPYSNSSYPYINVSASTSVFAQTSMLSSNAPKTKTVHLATSANPGSAGGVSPASGNYTLGSIVSISEVAATGRVFLNWTCTGAGCFSGPLTYGTVTMNNNITETANYKVAKTIFYQLTISANPSVGGTASPNIGTYLPGTNVTISATPSLNYAFSNWSCTGRGCYNGIDPEAKITMNNNITEAANFRKSNNMYTLAVTANPSAWGTVAGSGSYLSGSNVVISENTLAGSFFTGWSCSGIECYSGSNPSQKIIVTSNVIETANFQKTKPIFTLLTETNNQTGGDVLAGGSYAVGTQVVISAAAAPGWRFVDWTCTGQGCYSGTTPYAAIVLNSNVTEIGNFQKT